MQTVVNTIDLFCGAGGAETGLSLALKDLGLSKRGLAINHWQVAVDTMRENHQDTATLRMDLANTVPSDVAYAHKIDLLWASPACTHHSRAKGGKPRDNQLRAQPELLLTWMDQLNVVDLVVENVPEFTEWGPLLASGMPDKKRRGACFRAWVAAIEARGYRVEWRILCCADYGDATTRRRFFLRARKLSYIGRLGPIVWPEQTHTDGETDSLFGLKKWRGIIECLDLSNLGTSIFHRKRPLSPNTMRRVEKGLRKCYGNAFLVDFMGTKKPEDASRIHGLGEPMPTQATCNRFGLARPMIVQLNRGCDATPAEAPLPTVTSGGGHFMLANPVIFDYTKGGGVLSTEKPLPSQVCKAHSALLCPIIMDMSHPAEADGCRVASADCPLSTQTARRNHAVLMPVVIDHHFQNEARGSDAPMGTQTAVRNHSLAFPVTDGPVIVDVLMRMLTTEELAAAHSFPADYRLAGNVADRVKQIGNSVPVETARAICREIFRTRMKGVKK